MQDEPELLLIHGCGGKKCGFHAVLEPTGKGTVGLVEVLRGLLGMLDAGHGAIAQSNDAVDCVTVPKGERAGDFLVGEPHPAGIEAKCLCKEDQFLSVIANLFFGLIALRPSHDNVIPDSGELAVLPHAAGKGLGFLQYQLYVKADFGVDVLNGGRKGCRFGSLDGLVQVFPDGMPLLYCF